MNHKTIYDFTVPNLSGKPVELKQYEGKAILVVNIASRCGLTPQLEGLQRLYKKYADRGFEILSFPSDDFFQQPEDGPDVQMFCAENYGVSFPIFQKGIVRGKHAQPLYQWLADQSRVFGFRLYPVWNFQKYLLNSEGQLIDWFMPWTKPESVKITTAIESHLTNSLVEN